VTSAAGLAMGGLHPVVAVYATFLNRAFDQVLMDVALHRLPVTFVLDRAGVTGDDGASHNGMWDLAAFAGVPGIRIAAPRDEASLRAQLRESVAVDDGPSIVRFPKTPLPADLAVRRRVGGVDILHEPAVPRARAGGARAGGARAGGARAGGDGGDGGGEGGADVLLITIGALAHLGLEVADRLTGHGVSVTVADPRWVVPVDPAIVELGRRHRLVVTLEDGNRSGGIGARVSQALRDEDVDVPTRDIGVPARFLDHGTVAQVRVDIGLTVDEVTARVAAWLGALPPAA
jgi:1-deoxy-D-xylulose-5-phosphate synthase